MESQPPSDWKWLTDRNSSFRSGLNLLGNVVLFLVIAWALMDYNGFRQSLECKSWQPVIDAAKACPLGVRADLCYQPISNWSRDILNSEQVNLTGLFNPTPPVAQVG